MFGHDWEAAEGTVVDSRITGYTPVGPGYNEVARHEFVVDVRRADGTRFRATVEEPRDGKVLPPDVGAVVRVQIDRKGAVRFDESDPSINTRAVWKRQRAEEQDTFRRELAEPPGSPTPGPAPQAPRPRLGDDGRPS